MLPDETYFGRTTEELGEVAATAPARYLRKTATAAYTRAGFPGLALFMLNMLRHASATLRKSGGDETDIEALSLASDGFFIVGEKAPPEIEPLVARTLAVLAGEDEHLLQKLGRNEDFQKSYIVVELLLRDGTEHTLLTIVVSGLITVPELRTQDEKAYLNAVGNFWEDMWAELLVKRPPHPWSVS